MNTKPLPSSFRRRAAQSLLLGTCLFTVLCTATAQQPTHPFYLQAALGPAIAKDVKVREWAGTTPGSKVKLDPGIHLGLVGGCNATRWLAFEIETGIIANNVDRIGPDAPDAALAHVPLLANVVLKYETESSRVIPYLGVGAGGDSSVLAVDDSLGVDGSDSDLVFACQAMAGVRFRLRDNMSLGAGYKFFHAKSPTWEVRRSASDIRLGRAIVHTFGVVFNWSF